MIVRLHQHQWVDFDGSALINFFVGSALHWSATVRVGTGSCQQCVASAGHIDGLRRQCVVLAYIGADDRLTSAAQRFVDFSRTAAGQQRA